MSSSSSMVYFPVFEEPLDNGNGCGTRTTTSESSGIFSLFSNLFRPSGSGSSFSRNESSSSTNEKMTNIKTDEVYADRTEGLLIADFEVSDPPVENDLNGLLNPSSNDSAQGSISLVPKRLIDYKKSEFMRFWMPDSAGNECYECNEKFSTFRRRHHCRLCGQIFCKNCARCQMNGTELGYNGLLRLCSFCAEQVDAHIALRRERREPVKSFTQIESDDVFIGVPIANSSQENPNPLKYLRHSTGELPASEQQFPANGGSCANAIASSANRLEHLFEKKLDDLLDCLMLREQLSSEWRQLLCQLSKNVTDRIANLALRDKETLNILDFLHIKKLNLRNDLAPAPGAEIIHGVAFSKSLAHSAMPSSMKNVSLMLLNGTISYERVLEKFTSLEPMLAQERQYLRLQCDRVLSRRVSLLLTESSISPTAIALLMAEGISVVANVKPNVLLRVARASSADILSSLDAHFLQPRVGFVPKFCQREFPVAEGKCKRVLLLENGGGNFGVTVLLKGHSIRELVAAKRLLRFLVLSRFSSRLELSFLSMFDSVPRNFVPKRGEGNFHCHICELNARHNSDKGDNEDNGAESEHSELCAADFVRCLPSVHLSNSPAIAFSVPFLATSIGRRCPLAAFWKSTGTPLFHFFRSEDFVDFRTNFDTLQQKLDVIEKEENEQKMRNEKTMRHRCLDGKVMGEEPEKLLDREGWISFRTTSALHFRRRAELNRRAKEEKVQKHAALLVESEAEGAEPLARGDFRRDVFSPYNHQGIAFLYCANARRATNRRVEEATRIFCTGPYVLQRQFYHGKDTSLGVFLLNCCFNSDFKCKGCDRPMLDHFRRIMHGNTRIEVMTRNVANGGGGGGTFRNSSTSSLATVAVATVSPFVNGGIAAALPSSGGDDELNKAMPLDELPSSIPNNNCSAIICWLRCNSCFANSSIAKMTDEVFHLSFAKFVDYLANGSHWVSPFPSSIDLAECHHCTFHCHSHFFALGNFVAQFRVNPIYPLNVLFASNPCSIETPLKQQQETKTFSDIVLRDIADGKGTPLPDVGSVIAHALCQPSESRLLPGREKGSFGSLGSFSATANNGNKFADYLDIVYAEEHWNYNVKVYFPDQFERFRSLIFRDGEKSFVRSLSTSSPWYPQGGKSGAIFSRTDDERFVLKTMSRFELDAFKQSALKYIDYISMALMEGKLTALCKIFGAFTVNCANKQTGQSVKSDLLVMEYLFYRRDIKQIWDLKGSLRNRLASTKSDCSNGSSSVLLDENYIQNMWRNQMYVTAHSKTALSQAIINDSHFLADQGIMDYSLLAGVCRGEEDEVIVGIVDYMRTFTFDKKVESAIKNAIPLTNSSTVISPELYCRRFYEAIDGYFAVAPDQWTSDSVFT